MEDQELRDSSRLWTNVSAWAEVLQLKLALPLAAAASWFTRLPWESGDSVQLPISLSASLGLPWPPFRGPPLARAQRVFKGVTALPVPAPCLAGVPWRPAAIGEEDRTLAPLAGCGHRGGSSSAQRTSKTAG